MYNSDFIFFQSKLFSNFGRIDNPIFSKIHERGRIFSNWVQKNYSWHIERRMTNAKYFMFVQLFTYQQIFLFLRPGFFQRRDIRNFWRARKWIPLLSPRIRTKLGFWFFPAGIVPLQNFSRNFRIQQGCTCHHPGSTIVCWCGDIGSLDMREFHNIPKTPLFFRQMGIAPMFQHTTTHQ